MNGRFVFYSKRFSIKTRIGVDDVSRPNQKTTPCPPPSLCVCACVFLSVTASSFAWSHVRMREKSGQIDSNRATHGTIEVGPTVNNRGRKSGIKIEVRAQDVYLAV